MRSAILFGKLKCLREMWKVGIQLFLVIIMMGKLTREYGLEPNSVTLTAIIASRAGLLDLKRGKWMHREMVGKGFVFFVGSALVDMYVTCRCLEMAEVVSEQLLRKTVVAWYSLTAGYGLKGDSRECLKRFRRMNMEDRH
jgi:hypothetical protein